MAEEDPLDEDWKSQNLACRACSKDVAAVYNMLKWFNLETACQVLFGKAEEEFLMLDYCEFSTAPDFGSLRDASYAVDLMWNDHVAQIRLTGFDN